MTDTTELAAAPAADGHPAAGRALHMRLPELQALASSLGVNGTAKMRKGDLVPAIKARQTGGSAARPRGRPHHCRPAAAAPVADTSGPAQASTSAPAERPVRASRRAGRPAGTADAPRVGRTSSAPLSRRRREPHQPPPTVRRPGGRGPRRPEQRSDEQGQGERSRGRGRGDNGS